MLRILKEMMKNIKGLPANFIKGMMKNIKENDEEL